MWFVNWGRKHDKVEVIGDGPDAYIYRSKRATKSQGQAKEDLSQTNHGAKYPVVA